MKTVWAAAMERIPQIKTFCEEQIRNAELLQIDSVDCSEENEHDPDI